MAQLTQLKPLTMCLAVVAIWISGMSRGNQGDLLSDGERSQESSQYRIAFKHFQFKRPVEGQSWILSGELPDSLGSEMLSEGVLADYLKKWNLPQKMMVVFDRRDIENTEPYHALKLYHGRQPMSFRADYSFFPFLGAYEVAGILRKDFVLTHSYLVDKRRYQWPLNPLNKTVLSLFPFDEPVDLLMLILNKHQKESSSIAGTDSGVYKRLLSSFYQRFYKPGKPFFPDKLVQSDLSIDVVPVEVSPFMLLFFNELEQRMEQRLLLRVTQSDGAEEFKSISRESFDQLTEECSIDDNDFWRKLMNIQAQIYIEVGDLTTPCRQQANFINVLLSIGPVLKGILEVPGKRRKKAGTPDSTAIQHENGSSVSSNVSSSSRGADAGNDENSEGGLLPPPPPPGAVGSQSEVVDDQQDKVDALVMSSGKGRVHDIAKILSDSDHGLLFQLHSKRDDRFAGDTALHAAIRYNQQRSIEVIKQLTTEDEMAQLWALKNEHHVTPTELEWTLAVTSKATPAKPQGSVESQWLTLEASKKVSKKTRKKEKEKSLDELVTFITDSRFRAESIPLTPSKSGAAAQKSTDSMVGLGLGSVQRTRSHNRGIKRKDNLMVAIDDLAILGPIVQVQERAEWIEKTVFTYKYQKSTLSENEDFIQEVLKIKSDYENHCNDPSNLSDFSLKHLGRRKVRQCQVTAHMKIRASFSLFYDTWFEEHHHFEQELQGFLTSEPRRLEEAEKLIKRLLSFQAALIYNLDKAVKLAEHSTDRKVVQDSLEYNRKCVRDCSARFSQNIMNILSFIQDHPELSERVHGVLLNHFDLYRDQPLPYWKGEKSVQAFLFWARLLIQNSKLDRTWNLIEIFDGLDLNSASGLTQVILEATLIVLNQVLSQFADETQFYPIRLNHLNVLIRARQSLSQGWLAQQLIDLRQAKEGEVAVSGPTLTAIQQLLAQSEVIESELYEQLRQREEEDLKARKALITDLLKEEEMQRRIQTEQVKGKQKPSRLVARKEQKATMTRKQVSAEQNSVETAYESGNIDDAQDTVSAVERLIQTTSRSLRLREYGQYPEILTQCQSLLSDNRTPDQIVLRLYMAEIHTDIGLSMVNRISNQRDQIIKYHNEMIVTGRLPKNDSYKEFKKVVLELPVLERDIQEHLDSVHSILASIHIPETSEYQESLGFIRDTFQELLDQLHAIERKKELYNLDQIFEMRKALMAIRASSGAHRLKNPDISQEAMQDAKECDQKITEMIPQWSTLLERIKQLADSQR